MYFFFVLEDVEKKDTDEKKKERNEELKILKDKNPLTKKEYNDLLVSSFILGVCVMSLILKGTGFM